MIDATLHTVAVDLGADNHLFRANGSTVVNPGFMTVYQEDVDDKPKESDEKLLPPMEEGETISTNEIRADQHFTEPPRFNEASLVKKLEEFGIGRPSTYAAIISTLQQREYVEMDNKRFIPTDIGRIVNQFLTDHFTQYVDYDFTAKLEDYLDDIAAGDKEWKNVLNDYWQPFNKLVGDKGESLSRDEVKQTRELGVDEETGKPILVKIGRYGPYVQLGTVEDEKKPKFVGLLPNQSMHTITLEEAKQLLSLPRKLGMMDGKIQLVSTSDAMVLTSSTVMNLRLLAKTMICLPSRWNAQLNASSNAKKWKRKKSYLNLLIIKYKCLMVVMAPTSLTEKKTEKSPRTKPQTSSR